MAATAVRPPPSRRPIVLAVAAAAVVTIAVIVVVAATRSGQGDGGAIEKGRPAPAISGTTLDGAPFRLADLRGKPVILNFWGPTCVPCRTEFPLLKAKLAEHADDDLVIVGILAFDPPDLARTFIADQGATWATVDDPGGTIRQAYRVLARPQSYFVDRDGILRSIQVGEVQDVDFERQYAQISGGS